jgi:hypothetical protein
VLYSAIVSHLGDLFLQVNLGSLTPRKKGGGGGGGGGVCLWVGVGSRICLLHPKIRSIDV